MTLKEEPFFTPNVNIDRLTIVFRLIIGFPTSNNTFLGVIILVELMKKVNTKIFVRRKML